MSGAAEDTALATRQQALHQSTIKELTGGCSWQWKLRYIDELPDKAGWPAIIGTDVHAAVELHEQERIDARLERRKPVLPSEDQMVAAAHAELEQHDIGEQHDYQDGRPYNLETAKAALERAISYWWHEPIPAGQPGAGGTIRERLLSMLPVAVEPHFKVWLPGLSKPIGGWIDGVYHDPEAKRFRLVDSKTADNFGRWPTDGSVARLQPAQYALGALLSPNLPIWRELPEFEFQVMRTRPRGNSRFEGVRVIPVELSELDSAWVVEQAQRADQIITTRAFRPEPEKKGPLCSPRWCSFHSAPGSPCPAFPHPDGAGWPSMAALPVVDSSVFDGLEPPPEDVRDEPGIERANVTVNADGSPIPF